MSFLSHPDHSSIDNILYDNIQSARDLYVPIEIKRVSSLTSIEFLRDYVSKNIPVIFTDIACNWDAYHKWDLDYLVNKIGETEVTVSQTPNGRADAILSLSSSNYTILEESKESIDKQTKLFVMPHDEKMKFKQFVSLLKESSCNSSIPVNYIQYQNSNFTKEFNELKNDIDFSSLSFVEEVFGCKPDAINFWMGENRSVSSLHKDHYENMYAVISGVKKFILFPPTDRPYLNHEYVESAIFKPIDADNANETFVERMKNRSFGLSNISKDNAIPWIGVDPSNPDIEQYPLFKNTKPIICEIKEGEILYLPSLYFHQVSQQVDNEGKVIAVNFWFDMSFDIKYNYFSLLDDLAKHKLNS